MPNPEGLFAVNTRDLAAKIVEGEAVVMNLSTGVYYSLPGSGAVIWELLESGADVDTITSEVAGRYGVEPDAVRADIEHFLQTLIGEGMIEQSGSPQTPAKRLPQNATMAPYAPPTLEKHTDLGDLLALDPPMPGLKDLPGGGSER